MELQITGRNIELSLAVRSYVERKLGKLSRHLRNVTGAKVEVFEEATKSPLQRFGAQVTLDSTDTVFHSEGRGEELSIAVDKVVDTIDRQIERYKGRRYDKGRGSSAKSEFKEQLAAEPRRNVVKVKRFLIKPMSLAEAIDEMELLGHDFFLFLNAETEELNLLYRRKDGNYGVIEPELG